MHQPVDDREVEGDPRLAAVVPRRTGAALEEDELLAWLAPKVARYKLPRRVVFLEELPRSGYGKITKKMIREELEARGMIA